MFNRIGQGTSGVYLCNPESDTIFHYDKDKILTPVICKTPLASSLDPKIVFLSFTDIGRYQFMSDIKIVNRMEGKDNPPSHYYGYEKQTGEIFSPKISMPDYKGEYFNSLHGIIVGGKILGLLTMDLYRLKQAYNENRLSGKLKDIVSTLNENEDNDVFVFATMK